MKSLLNRLLLITKPMWENWFRRKVAGQAPEAILILRLDRMGDYLLWRNFLKEIKTSEKYGQYSLTLCGNSAWMDLARQLDREWVDTFIDLDVYRFNHQKWVGYRFRKLLEINKKPYSLLLHPTFSRTKESDQLVSLIRAKEKVGQLGDETNLTRSEKAQSDSLYSRLIVPDPAFRFEFERNRHFFWKALGVGYSAKGPAIGVPTDKTPGAHVVIFPGAGHPSRQWSTEKFALLCERIWKHYGYKSVVTGTSSEKKLAESIQNQGVLHMIDKTGCPVEELLELLPAARFAVANDSAGYHLAVCSGIPTVCVSNGNHYGRFLPYPVSYGKEVYYCFPEEMRAGQLSEDDLVATCGRSSPYDIDSITVDQVWDTVIGLCEPQNIL